MAKKKKKNSASGLGAPALKRTLQHMQSLIQRGRLEDAAGLAAKLPEEGPLAGRVHEAWALLHAAQGDQAAAARRFARAAAHITDDPMLHVQAASAAFQCGDFQAAAANFAAAVALAPHLTAVHRNLAVTYHRLGRSREAMEAFLKAFAAEPDHGETLHALSVLASDAAVYHHPDFQRPRADLVAALCVLLKDPTRRAQGLAPAAGYQLAARYGPDTPPETWAADPLTLLLLPAAVNVTLALEPALAALRRKLLQRVLETPGDVPHALLAALAAQCFLNEYFWPETQEESGLVHTLSERLDAAATPVSVTALALYRPVHRDARAGAWLALDWAAPYDMAARTLLAEPLREAADLARIPTLHPPTDAVSRAVRAQYEEHPFPRWTNVGAGLSPLGQAFSAHFPGAAMPPGLERVSHILIAGCGTGQHPVGVALANPAADILAVDLSRASLAYARRKAAEAGLTRLSFAQADILAMDGHETRYDHIEAMGVLHHMGDPLRGWRILRGLLQPGGTMRIGLYSETARAAVVRARELIAARGVRADLAGIRGFRAHLLGSPDLADVCRGLMGLDFFSVSTLRDLIFHVSEQRYTLPRLAEELAALRLTFQGFELPAPVRAAYVARFPDDPMGRDLGKWAQFEADHPQTFKAMYNFWAVAADGPTPA